MQDGTTTIEGPIPHAHKYLVDDDGNGVADVANEHIHKIEKWYVTASDDHTHYLQRY